MENQEKKARNRTEPVELTVLCLLRQGDRLLLQNRVKEDWAGYTLPGGHVKPGESFVDAVIREMKEETGLDIAGPRLCGIKQFPGGEGRYVVLLFTCDSFTGELISSEEGEMHWVRRADLDSVPLVSDFHELLKVFDHAEFSEFQYVVDEQGNWNIHIR